CMDPAPCTPTKLADGFGSKSLPVPDSLESGIHPGGAGSSASLSGIRRERFFLSRSDLLNESAAVKSKIRKSNEAPENQRRSPSCNAHGFAAPLGARGALLATCHVGTCRRAGLPGRKRGASMRHGRLQPPRPRDQSLPAPARAQSGRLVPVGRRGLRARARRGQAGAALDRVLGVSLVPRDGA